MPQTDYHSVDFRSSGDADSNATWQAAVDKALGDLQLDDASIHRLMRQYASEMRCGLDASQEERSKTCLAMEVYHIPQLLDGTGNLVRQNRAVSRYARYVCVA